MKLWEKGISTEKRIEDFTVGKDRELDLLLAGYDVYGSMAHARMLAQIGLLGKDEQQQLHKGLQRVLQEIEQGHFVIEDSVEDIHSQVELQLTRQLGSAGKKIHSGRSRNDQVLVDIRMFLRAALQDVVEAIQPLFASLQAQSEAHKDLLMPGYTHLQVAMPSSFGLWFGAYAEALTDDMALLRAAYEVCNQNPLGSAAGYGSSFPLDRSLTTRLLGFADLSYNVVYAQMGRGKTEAFAAMALAAVGTTLNKFAADACLFMSQNFGFIQLPDSLTTGSSIMPHKKNPDVFELVRGKTNQLQSLPGQIMQMTANLSSGYFRDYQLLKETLFPAFSTLRSVLEILQFAVENIHVQPGILDDPRYRYIYSVEAVNSKVQQGVPFRDAYRQVAADIADGSFEPPENLAHTHEGSIGKLCTGDIARKMEKQLAAFPFASVQQALDKLRQA